MALSCQRALATPFSKPALYHSAVRVMAVTWLHTNPPPASPLPSDGDPASEGVRASDPASTAPGVPPVPPVPPLPPVPLDPPVPTEMPPAPPLPPAAPLPPAEDDVQPSSET